MSRVSTCPKCTQPVTIPDGLEPSTTVHCPTCEAEYPLSEVSAEAEGTESGDEMAAFLKSLERDAYGDSGAGSPPPELVPVAAVAAGTATPDEDVPEQPSDLVIEDDSAASPAEPSAQGADAPLTPEAVLPEPVFASAAGAGPGDGAEKAPESGDGAESEGASAALETDFAAPGPPSETAAEPTGEPTGEPMAEALPEGSDAGPPAAAEGPADQGPPAEEPPPLDLDPLVRSPQGDQEFHLSELIVAATGEALGTVAASMIVRQDLLRAISEEEARAAEAAASPAAEAGEAWDYSAFAVRDEEATAEGEAVGRPGPPRPRRKSKEKHPIRHMAEIVIGGGMGLLIGYYLLNIFGGARFDFAEVYLPGVKHTYKHAPAWLPDWAKAGVSKTNGGEGEGEPAPEQPKPGTKKPAPTKPSGETPGPGDKPFPEIPPPEEPGEKPGEKPAEKPAGKPVAKPGTQPADGIELASGRSFTSDDLGKALKETAQAFGCSKCNSTGKVTRSVTEVQEVDGQKKEVQKQVDVECDACKGHPSKDMTDAAYVAFCNLGEVLAFVKGDDGQGQLGDRKLAARAVLESAAGEPGNADKIGERAAELLDNSDRLKPGVLLAGKIEKTASEGAYHVTEVLLAKATQPVTLVSRQPLSAAQGDQVAVLGAIVEEPRSNLRGYAGDKPLVIVVGTGVKVP